MNIDEKVVDLSFVVLTPEKVYGYVMRGLSKRMTLIVVIFASYLIIVSLLYIESNY